MHATDSESTTLPASVWPPDAAGDLAGHDLAPLAWLIEEVRNALDLARTAVRQQLPDGQASALQLARTQLHQAAGALAMVRASAPEQVVRAMESAVQLFLDQPQKRSEAGIVAIERAGFAVAEFLEGLLAGKPWSGVMLFPQQRQVLEILGAQRIHPADLWRPPAWAWHLPARAPASQTGPLDAGQRGRMDQAVLRLVKAGETPGGAASDREAAHDLARLCAELADTPSGPAARSLWWLASGFFEALALALIPLDRFAKRTASQVLLHYAQFAKGEVVASERLGQDLAFFCAQAQAARPDDTPQLAEVRRAWQLEGHQPVRYDQAQLGRFDPQQLSEVRKRLVAVRESWAALSGGDASRLRSTSHQLTQLREGLVRLHPPFEALADGLVSMAQDLAGQGQAPHPELAMEVATAILYLEAACQDFDPEQVEQVTRLQQLADRLARARQGQPPPPLEAWVEELYRQASHRQTMGSVVDELRACLAEVEKELDAFARDTRQREGLQSVPGRLVQMRGILSVLGLDHAAQAVAWMRDTVQSLLQLPGDPPPADWDALGRNLGTLGFLIDMLSYQPSLARKLFVFDLTLGELRPVMGRVDAVDPREAASDGQDRVKVIGSLRIELDLFNVYLNEADEWSRCLQVELSEWSVDPSQPVPDRAVLLAHSLGGSSATVGFMVLSDLARLLEASLQRTQALACGTPEHVRAYNDAAEEIRRLLHQFAAGFLPQVRPTVPAALKSLEDLQLASRSQPEPVPEPEPAPIHAAGPQAPDNFEVAVMPAPGLPSGPAQPEPSAQPGAPNGPSETLDPELFTFFEEEALELLPRLGHAVREWHARPDHPSAREEVMRTLHTLKGSARLAGALALGDIAHALESVVEGLGPVASPAPLQALMDGTDHLQSAFEALRHSARAAAPRTQGVVEPCPPEVPGGGLPVAGTPRGALAAGAGAVASDVASQEPVAPPAPPLPAQATPGARPTDPVVRVRTRLLDRLVNQTGEVMITRARLAADMVVLRGALQELTGNLERLRHQLRDLELQSELQMQSRQAKDMGADFDPLEFDRFTRVQELARMLAESVGDVATVQRSLQRAADSAEDNLRAQAHQARELQRDLLRTRMVEFDSIADRLHRVVRLAAQETGKQAALEIRGGSIEMDRGILERMTPAFEHLLRNALAHGVESSEARRSAGKPPEGRISISLSQEGNDVTLRFEDDGAGLDLARIRDKAQDLGLIEPGQQVGEADAARLIFSPGFSTANAVSALAGRGIGMDVVRSEVQSVGGHISSRSQAGAGTCFEIVLPLTTAVTQVVLLRCGTLVFGVPVPLVEAVQNTGAPAREEAYRTGRFPHGGEALPFHWTGALLQASPASQEPAERAAPVVILRSAAQRLALHVDEVIGHQEVVVKHLGPQLARVPGLAGVTVLPSGAVVLIYNPVALATVHGPQSQALPAQAGRPPSVTGQGSVPQDPAALPRPLVLVVDDSTTVRRVTQRLLEREGLRVALASDGLQALDQLAKETPCVILSDIEMPRMDGFDLARQVRAEPRWSQVPIVMISSRTASKHREHAKALGVNHYLGKPFSEEELLRLVWGYAVSPPAS